MTAKRRIALAVVLTLALIVAAGFGYYEFVLRRPVATDDPYGLWIAALKGFEGTVGYVGDAEGYSYFVTGSDHTPRYKRRIAETDLPKHFPLGTEPPYRVTQEMVPRYIPPTSDVQSGRQSSKTDG